jgi:hypothetical protein
VEDIRIAGRNTQGVTLLKTGPDEVVVSATCIAPMDAAGETEALPIEKEIHAVEAAALPATPEDDRPA